MARHISVSPLDRFCDAVFYPEGDWRIIDEGQAAFADALQATGCHEDSSLPTLSRCPGGNFVVSFFDNARFLIDPTARTLTIFDVRTSVDQAALEHFLFDHIVPRIMEHEGNLVLHCSAVRIDSKLALFLGDSGAGKSTLAASLHEAGHVLLGDDATVVSIECGRYVGQAVYRSLRLHPEAITRIFGDNVEASPMAHYSAKLRVKLPVVNANAARTSPLAGLFFLSGQSSQTEPRASALRPSEACMALVEQSFALDPEDAGRAVSRLARLAKLADSVPAYRLTYPHDYARMKDLHGVIFSCLGLSSESIEENNIAPADK